MIVDHTPHIVDDTDWGHRGRAYAMGYIKALMDMLNAISGSSEG
jgi:mannonate dehydratase